jgi:hypothetical protein
VQPNDGAVSGRMGITPRIPLQLGRSTGGGGEHDRGSNDARRGDHGGAYDFGRQYARNGENEHRGDHERGDYRRDYGDHDHHHWNGGYWQGRYWPHAYDAGNYVWFLPALPSSYVTYWWDGTPYYYYNNAYYIWDPGYSGYVAAEPPPASDSGVVTDDVGELYAYPMNGQGPEQQAQDRRECEQWAAAQTDADSSSAEYRRALAACLTGRGYSVQ